MGWEAQALRGVVAGSCAATTGWEGVDRLKEAVRSLDTAKSALTSSNCRRRDS